MPPTPRLLPALPRTHLLLDWDSTLTLTDTLSVIARIGYRLPSPPSPPHQAPNAPSNLQSPSTPTNPTTHFSTLTKTYTTDLASHTSTYIRPASQRRTVAAELAFLESLRVVEERSVRHVEEAGVFRGVMGRDVDAAAGQSVQRGEVRLRRGWEGCVWDVLRVGEEEQGEGVEGAVDGKGKGKVSVVSVGWSARFIRACLSHAAVMGAVGERVRRQEMVKGIKIVANEIEGLDAEGGSSGMLSRWFGEEGGGIWTAGDKGRVVRRLIAEGEGVGEGRMRTVYVGDSVTDLECLMLVDVGICVRDEPLQSGQEALREVLERVGVRCRWIGEMEGEHIGRGDQGVESGNGGREKGLWWARDFEEIRQSALFRGPMRTGSGTLDGHLSNSMHTAGS